MSGDDAFRLASTRTGFALAEEGTDTGLIQDYLGHRSIANTVVYTETSAKRLASVRVR
jgi:site-specific recombinase XerD